MPDLAKDVERELAAIDDALAGRPVDPDLGDLGALALLIREERPRPGPAFASELDAKVARGFGSPPGPRRAATSPRRWTSWLNPAILGTATAALVAVALVLVLPRDGGEQPTFGGGGATAGSESGGGSEMAPNAQDSAAGAAGDAGPDAATSSTDSLAVPPVAPSPGRGSPGSDGRQARKVERSASLTLAVRPRNLDAVSARVQEVTHAQGGFVAASTVTSTPEGGEGTFDLRIPTRNLDAALASLARLGKVRDRAQSARDITAKSVSTRDTLADARAERRSLLRQLGAAVTLAQTESLRARLRLVSAEIRRARAAVRRVDNRAAYSTVGVTLVSDYTGTGTTEEDGVWSPGDAARDALRVLEVVASVALVALAVALPLGLLALLGVLTLRWTGRRRRERALDAV